MKITREQLRTIVGEVLQEEKDYQSFFQAMLKKHGVSSPDEFKSDEEKKAFFNKVEDTWKGVSERLVQLKEDELTAKQQKIDLNKNGKVDGDDLSKLRAGTKTEAELSAAQQKIDLNKNGKVDGSDLSKLRAGAKTEGEEQLPQTKILSKEGETLVKSGAGNMYNISKVNESKESDINAKIDKLLSDAEAGKIKTFDEFLDKFYPLQKQLKSLRKESVNEGRYDADLDKIEAAVKNALSFMNVGAELRKAGIKYDFSTSMIPMYMIKVSGTLIAIVNKKHANGPERVVNDIAIGVLN
jgi:hypothetical protein